MAIDPTTVNILNINELQTATSVQENDLLVIGQGIYARKTTVLALYNKFDIQSLVDDVMTLQGDIADLGLINAVQFSPQILTPTQQQTARDNIDVYSREEIDNEIAIWRTTLYDETFVFDSSTNPTQQFTLAFTPTQMDMVFDTNTPIWMDQGDFIVVGNILTINYTLENNAIIKINYWKYA